MKDDMGWETVDIPWESGRFLKEVARISPDTVLVLSCPPDAPRRLILYSFRPILRISGRGWCWMGEILRDGEFISNESFPGIHKGLPSEDFKKALEIGSQLAPFLL